MTLERTYKALLIGNSVYNDTDLQSLVGPQNDLMAMRAALTDLNWGLHASDNVQILEDASKRDMEESIEAFFGEASASDQLLFYFSGHGLHEVYDRLFFAAADTNEARPLSTAVPMAFLNEVAKTTRAAATAIILDCCYSGIMKGSNIADALDARGRWTLASSRRDQLSRDARHSGDCSAFTELVTRALVANAALDADGDGFVTMADVNRHVAPLLRASTGQDATFRFEGTGELAVALAPGYPVDVDQSREEWARGSGTQVVRAPRVPPPHQALPDNEVQVEAFDSKFKGIRASYDDAERLVDVDNRVSWRRSLRVARKQATRAIESSDGLPVVLDSLNWLTSLAAAAIDHRATHFLNDVLGALEEVYEAGFDGQGFTKVDPTVAGGVRVQEVWLAILDRIFVLGALAVRGENWDAVVDISARRPQGYDFRYYTSWLRHAQVMASRENLYRVEVSQGVGEDSQIRRSERLALRLASEGVDALEMNEDRLRTSLCEFDFLACVAVSLRHGGVKNANVYPSFARAFTRRAERAAVLLLEDAEARRVIAPASDKDLAEVFRDLDELAQYEGIRFDGWRGFDDPLVLGWLSTHAEDRS